MEQAFQTDGPGKHLVKAVVAGGDAAGVLLKSRPLQQGFQSQPDQFHGRLRTGLEPALKAEILDLL